MRWLFVVALAGCYSPRVATGVPCGEDGACPRGQICDPGSGLCTTTLEPDATTAVDAAADAPADAAPLGPWGVPVALDELNTNMRELDPTLSADGLEIFFASNRGNGANGTFDIYRATRATTSDPFSPPQRVVELSTAASEVGIHLSADGLTAWFYRQNPAQFDVFRATRPSRDQPFGAAMPEPALSQPDDDRDPSLTADGLLVVVEHEETEEDHEIYLYERASIAAPWGAPRKLTEVSSAVSDGAAALDAAGLVLVFHSDRPDGGLLHDLFIATRASRGEPFSAPEPIVELNTAQFDEGNPEISADLRTIVFDRTDDLYIATR